MGLSKTFKNTLFLLFARVASSFLSLFVVVIIARGLGVEVLGKFALIYAYFLIFTEIPLLGLNIFITRELTKGQDYSRKFFFISNALSYISVVVLSVIIVLIIYLAGYPKDVSSALFWVLLATIPSGFITVVQAFFMAFERFKLMSSIVIAENFLRSLGAVLILLFHGNIVQIFFLFFVLRLVFFGVHYKAIDKIGMLPKQFVWDRDLFIFTLRHWPVFSAIYIISILISRIDQVLLSKLGTLSDVGIYSASYKFLDFFLMAPTALSFVVFPFFSKMDLNNDVNKRIISIIIKYFSILAIPLIAFFFFCSEQFIALFYGDKFSNSALVLSILIWNFLVTGCDQVLGLLMISQNKQQTDLKFLLHTIIIYVVLLFALIPKYHFIGAAIATVVSSVFLTGSKLTYLSRSIYKIRFDGLFRNLSFAVILFAIFFMLRMYWPVNSLISWMSFVILYTCGAFIFNIATRDENKIVYLAFFKNVNK